jgi:hypothetical protein
MALPIDKTLKFFIRFNRSIHPELSSNYTVWLKDGKRWMNCGDAPSIQAAWVKAEKIARCGKRQIEFVQEMQEAQNVAHSPS